MGHELDTASSMVSCVVTTMIGSVSWSATFSEF